MSGQPDLILRLAHKVGSDYEEKGMNVVGVRADTSVSLNGRPPVPLIVPSANLMQVEEGIAPADWITPAPQSDPIRLQSYHDSN